MDELYDSTFYRALMKFILKDKELKQHGFPFSHPLGQLGRAKVYELEPRNKTWYTRVPNKRICPRCGRSFIVNASGFAIKRERCRYHPGVQIKCNGTRYTCCDKYEPTGGCVIANNHVWRYIDAERLYGFVETYSRASIPAEKQGIYAVDCKMCYTTQGFDVNKITVVNENYQVVYETFIMPAGPIIDYNTLYSGITADTMPKVASSLADVHAQLLKLFSQNTILIGHRLDIQLRGLKFIHPTIVDTSVVYPHIPVKRSLKSLSAEYLNKPLPQFGEDHVGSEGAVTCMELMKLKVGMPL